MALVHDAQAAVAEAGGSYAGRRGGVRRAAARKSSARSMSAAGTRAVLAQIARAALRTFSTLCSRSPASASADAPRSSRSTTTSTSSTTRPASRNGAHGFELGAAAGDDVVDHQRALAGAELALDRAAWCRSPSPPCARRSSAVRRSATSPPPAAGRRTECRRCGRSGASAARCSMRARHARQRVRMGDQHAQVEIERRSAAVLQRELAEAHRADAVQQLAQLARDGGVVVGSRASAMRLRVALDPAARPRQLTGRSDGRLLDEPVDGFELRRSAVRTHSRHTISTVDGTAPEPMIFSQPTRRSCSRAGGDGVERHVHLVAAVQQIVHGLVHAGVRFDAAHDDLRRGRARAGRSTNARLPAAAHRHLLDHLRRRAGSPRRLPAAVWPMPFGYCSVASTGTLDELGRIDQLRTARTMRSCSTVWPR